MPRTSPYAIVLTEEERDILEAAASYYTSPYYQVVRAKISLLAAQNLDNASIAARHNHPHQIVSKWRKRVILHRLDGMDDEPRKGRPPVFPPRVVVEIKAMACRLPAEYHIPVSHFSHDRLADLACERGLVSSISGTMVWRCPLSLPNPAIWTDIAGKGGRIPS